MHRDRFPDVGKMIRSSLLSIFAGGFCFANNLFKVFPLIISKQLLQLSGVPKFDTVLLVNAIFEVFVEFGDEIVFHNLQK